MKYEKRPQFKRGDRVRSTLARIQDPPQLGTVVEDTERYRTGDFTMVLMDSDKRETLFSNKVLMRWTEPITTAEEVSS